MNRKVKSSQDIVDINDFKCSKYDHQYVRLEKIVVFFQKKKGF